MCFSFINYILEKKLYKINREFNYRHYNTYKLKKYSDKLLIIVIFCYVNNFKLP